MPHLVEDHTTPDIVKHVVEDGFFVGGDLGCRIAPCGVIEPLVVGVGRILEQDEVLVRAGKPGHVAKP